MKSPIWSCLTLLWASFCVSTTSSSILTARGVTSKQPDISKEDWRVYAALYYRPELPPEDVQSAARFHWAIHCTQPGNGKTHMYHATNTFHRQAIGAEANQFDSRKFRYETRDIDPMNQQSLIARIQIDSLGWNQISQMNEKLSSVKLPDKTLNPFSDCSEWAFDAITAIKKGMTSNVFDLGQFEKAALAYADQQLDAADITGRVNPEAGRRIATRLAKYDTRIKKVVEEPPALKLVNGHDPIPAANAALKNHDVSSEGIFFTTDQRPVEEVFMNGIKPAGHNLKILDHLAPEFRKISGFVSLYRSKKAVESLSKETRPVIFVISPKGVPDGYYLPELKSIKGFAEYKKTIQKELEFAAAGKVPGISVLGAYEKAPELEGKWVWRPNQNSVEPSASAKDLWCFGRKRQATCTDYGGLAEEELPDEIYTRFVEKEFKRLGASFGLGAEIQRSSSAEISTLSRIHKSLVAAGKANLAFKSILPRVYRAVKGSLNVVIKGGLKLLLPIALVEWTREMVDVFRSDSRAWEQVAVATSLIPIIGCETRLAANIDSGSESTSSMGNAVDFSFCMTTDAMLFTPAWPLALFLKIGEIAFNWIATPKSPDKSIRVALQHKRLEEWEKYQTELIQSWLKRLRESPFRTKINQQLKAEALSVVVAATKVAGGLYTGTLAYATNAEHRREIMHRGRYAGALSLHIEMCREFVLKRQKLADETVNWVAAELNKTQAKFNDVFFKHAVKHLVDSRQVIDDSHIVSWIKQMPNLPAPVFRRDAFRTLVLAALTWEPLACKPSCKIDDGRRCLWAHCGAVSPPSDDEVRANGLEVYATTPSQEGSTQRYSNVSKDCIRSFSKFCFPVQIAMLRKAELWEPEKSKLLCPPKGPAADISLTDGSLPKSAPDYHNWVKVDESTGEV